LRPPDVLGWVASTAIIALLVYGREVVSDVRDMVGDSTVGFKTTAIISGPKKAVKVAQACWTIAAIIILISVFVAYFDFRNYSYIGMGLATESSLVMSILLIRINYLKPYVISLLGICTMTFYLAAATFLLS
jgi:4-hydroxybenzoate polyprenyltransferase